MQAHQSKHSIDGSTSRERERCVFFLYFVSFFYSGNSSTYFKVCVDLCKKSDRTRCLAVSIFLSTILTGIRSRQSEQKRFGFLQEERNSVVIRRLNIGDPAYRIV